MAEKTSIYSDSRFSSNIVIAGKTEISHKSPSSDTRYVNTQQGIIEITEDRLELNIRDYETMIKRSDRWQTPLGIAVTLAVAMATADFKSCFGFSADTITAIFAVVLIISSACCAYGVYCGFKVRKSIRSPKDFVKLCRGNYHAQDSRSNNPEINR